MKYELVLTGRFKRGLKIAKKRGLNISLLEDIVEKLLHKIPLEPNNKDHALIGNYKGYRECHIQPDWLLFNNCGRWDLKYRYFKKLIERGFPIHHLRSVTQSHAFVF